MSKKHTTFIIYAKELAKKRGTRNRLTNLQWDILACIARYIPERENETDNTKGFYSFHSAWIIRERMVEELGAENQSIRRSLKDLEKRLNTSIRASQAFAGRAMIYTLEPQSLIEYLHCLKPDEPYLEKLTKEILARSERSQKVNLDGLDSLESFCEEYERKLVLSRIEAYKAESRRKHTRNTGVRVRQEQSALTQAPSGSTFRSDISPVPLEEHERNRVEGSTICTPNGSAIRYPNGGAIRYPNGSTICTPHVLNNDINNDLMDVDSVMVTSSEATAPPTREQRIINYLNTHPHPHTGREIADALNDDYPSVKSALTRLARTNQIAQNHHGQFHAGKNTFLIWKAPKSTEVTITALGRLEQLKTKEGKDVTQGIARKDIYAFTQSNMRPYNDEEQPLSEQAIDEALKSLVGYGFAVKPRRGCYRLKSLEEIEQSHDNRVARWVEGLISSEVHEERQDAWYGTIGR